MNQDFGSFIIIGLTCEGRKFRPSDWAERLSGIMSAFGTDNRMKYSPYVRPGHNPRGDKTVTVDGRLHDIEPLAYNFLAHFARDNHLQVEALGVIHEGVRPHDAAAGAANQAPRLRLVATA